MADYDPLDSSSDPFGPPKISVMVSCLHCGEEYDSYRIEWRVETGADGKPHGFWCCPTAGCDGKGFGFDILPVDSNYRDERGGWVYCDDDEEDEDFDDSGWEKPANTNGDGDEGTDLNKPAVDDDDESIPF
jgi:hypothetical protein